LAGDDRLGAIPGGVLDAGDAPAFADQDLGGDGLVLDGRAGGLGAVEVDDGLVLGADRAERDAARAADAGVRVAGLRRRADLERHVLEGGAGDGLRDVLVEVALGDGRDVVGGRARRAVGLGAVAGDTEL